eukprot:gnl/TRDRNA2_/TRDRNA2_89821_c0_seq1.p1 gnl/TRDRNA2_/TRDRNA2_89821_c0~~gnl/TRDRNA2_/TRDRNA2_89821_c0_seq1.p1  ORF type:complete len:388 (+),score=41.78 gnl/TRDRNA2_/TRDRNA2_89821_c0_seq1:48-1211(+)
MRGVMFGFWIWILAAVTMLDSPLGVVAESFNGSRLSPGCSRKKSPEHHVNLTQRHVFVPGPAGLSANRSFLYTIPKSYFALPSGTPAPLLLFFHGQDGDSQGAAQAFGFDSVAAQDHVVTAYPQGMSEGDDYVSGWNVGTAGDNSTCIDGTSNSVCFPSCQALGKCGRCDWSTCYDDIAFVGKILDLLAEELCLDLGRMFVGGESNGGMFVHYLIHQMPNRFAAAVPLYGLPLLGYLAGGDYQLWAEAAAGNTGPALIQFHGRSDPVIPPEGGEDSDGWIYETLQRSLGTWAAVKGCGHSAPEPLVTPWEGGPQHISCEEYPLCRLNVSGSNPPKSFGRVAWCMYDGEHGSSYWPATATWIAWQFLMKAPPIQPQPQVGTSIHTFVV